jgi:hypothetical protein
VTFLKTILVAIGGQFIIDGLYYSLKERRIDITKDKLREDITNRFTEHDQYLKWEDEYNKETERLISSGFKDCDDSTYVDPTWDDKTQTSILNGKPI